MAPPFLGIDHAVVTVRDLDAAARNWERLGFLVAPRSEHPELGSANRCIVMQGDYIELLSPGGHPSTRFFADFVAKREGMAALAARSSDIVATREALTRARLNSTEPMSFTRDAVMPNGAIETAQFTVSLLDESYTDGGLLFACQHHTPQFVWPKGYEHHPNGAERISAIIFTSPTAPKAARFFERIFNSVGRGGPNSSVEVKTGDAPIFVLPSEGVKSRYHSAAEGIEGPCYAGLSIQVYDLADTARVLTENGVPFTGSTALHLLVHPREANGVLLEFYRR